MTSDTKKKRNNRLERKGEVREIKTFRDIAVGDYFQFAPSKCGFYQFRSICQKVSARCYTHRAGLGGVHTAKSQIGTVRSEVISVAHYVALTDAMNNAKAEMQRLWQAACEFEGIERSASFVIFSKVNPYSQLLDNLMAVYWEVKQAFDLWYVETFHNERREK